MLKRALMQAKTVAIGGHVRPDGDCVGSCMGLYQYIKDCYKDLEVDVYLEDIPESFKKFIEATKDILHTVNEEKTYDLFIALDCGDMGRLGFSGVLFEKAKGTLCIDHHVSNQAFADENYIVPDASSTSELVYRLLEKENITTEIAECLYLGIVHDSGVFKYPNTSRRTMEIGGILVEKGIEKTSLIDQTFFRKSYVQNQILGRVLLESILVLNGKVIASRVTKKMMDFYGATTEDLDGIVEQMRITDGVEMAIFLHEVEPLLYKVSMRANEKMDVSAIAQHFGGGGHVKAAGCTMHGTYYDILNSLLTFADAQLQ